jgi:serine/threonine-protein kinase
LSANATPDPQATWPTEVEQQLQRMLSSPVFQRAARPARFLEFVVRRSAHKPGEPLAESDIATFVYDRSDFDPRLDPIVRVEAARLRKRIQEYYENQGKNDPIEIRLPQRGYLPEIAPKAVAQDDCGAPPKTPLASAMQLAVLPFVNLSEDPKMTPFCLGLTEEVIASATDLANISVVSRTSAFQYEGESVDIRAVGKDLGVTHVLEGSVRLGDKHIRVTAKLIDCGSGFTTWSKTYEKVTEDDQVMLQVSLGGMIAETLAEKTDSRPAA